MRYQNITIHYDFKDGTELPYGVAINEEHPFTTNCLEFFSTENVNAVVVMKNGKCIAVRDLLSGEIKHTDKKIRKEHNLHKMLIAGVFKWQ